MIKPLSLLASLGLWALPSGAHAVSLRLHSKAWTDVGQIMHATDTLQVNMNGNREQSMGMQVNGIVDLGENLEGGFGFGMNQVYHSLGDLEQEKFTLSKFINYVSEARVTYSLGEKANPLFSATVGDFAYNYNPEVKNLGLYLFRGPVYPGFLVSGFQEFHTDTTRASFLGLHLRNAFGKFRHDLVFYSERDLPPSFDWSLGYVAKYQPVDGLEFGAGVNFYHLIPDDADITTPNNRKVNGLFTPDSSLYAAGGKVDPYQLKYMEIVAPGDTLVYTHQGTKVMAMFDMDFKKVFGFSGGLGKKDLILYGEGAIVGVKNQGTIYAHITDRMPIMLGFNLPARSWTPWGWLQLDFLSVEVERYTAKYKADYSKLGYDQSLYFKNIPPAQLLAQTQPSAIPISTKDLAGNRFTVTPEGDFQNIQTGEIIKVKGTDLDPENLTADDWKWSLNAEKTVAGHVRFSGQIANDHFVPRPVRGNPIAESAGLAQVFSSLRDWYFMFRVGYFF
jgi:hypothetical protein